MNVVSIQTLVQISNALSSDFFHALKTNDYSKLLSYKIFVENMGDVFEKNTLTSDIQKTIDAAINELQAVSASMLLKAEADSVYAKTETLQAKIPGLVTNSGLLTELSKYPKQERLNAKREELYAEARRLADEMTDFTGAAMVGINQSNASYQTSANTEKTD